MPGRLPAVPLRPLGPASAACLAHDLTDLRAAADHVMRLPYGRGVARDDLGILTEHRGTCSTKHALLARLAREHSVALELVVGIYLMNADNTPGTGPVLAAHHLPAIPEAHCVLHWQGALIDLTRPGITAPPSFLRTWTICPEDIAVHKPELHREFLATWLPAHLPGWTLDRLWRVREACIAALPA